MENELLNDLAEFSKGPVMLAKGLVVLVKGPTEKELSKEPEDIELLKEGLVNEFVGVPVLHVESIRGAEHWSLE